jgi:class 3 adenylate cyclase/tetratricopeptide (TPR) repeat protein
VAEVSTQTATILVTDLVASTELRARLGEEAAERLRRVHDSLLRAAVEAAGGRVVKGLGDGVLASFAGAADALAAATAIQCGIARHGRRHRGEPLSVRIGVSAGDVSVEDGDVFGTPVIEASRLCAAAAGGTILAADLVALLARGRGGHRLEPAGEMVLKGLADPVGVVRVEWEEDLASLLPLPAALAAEDPVPLVGRAAELGRLLDAWRSSRFAGRRVALVAGEPGVGKTRLVKELASVAHGEGAVVLLGRCDDAVPAPLRPVAEIVRHVAQHRPDVLAALPAREQAVLERLLLAGREPMGPDADPVTETLERHEAVDALLAALSEEVPVVVVLDDLHWADPATLLLLRHLGSGSSAGELLVVATYRDTDVDRTHPLADTLAALRRVSGVERVLLRGLDEEATAALVAAWSGSEAPRAFVAAVFAGTEGNPFFVGEVLEHLAETGAVRRDEDGGWVTDGPVAELGIPDGVRETVGRRLSQLGPATAEVLSVAAVTGRRFEIDVVADAGGMSEADALDVLEPALRRGLVVEGDTLGRFEFSHALVRSTLLDELVTLRRVRMHQRIGASIERLRADHLMDHADDLAYHFGQAAAAGEWDRAVRYHVLAAERAEGLGDPAGVEAHLTQALDIHDRSGRDDPDRELDLVVRLTTTLGVSRELERGRTLLDRGLAIATRTRSPDHIARALGPTMWFAESGAGNHELSAAGEKLLRLLPGDDSRARVAALTWRAHLRSMSMVSREDFEDTLANAEDALAMAERLDWSDGVAAALLTLNNCLLSQWQVRRALDAVERAEQVYAHLQGTGRTSAWTWLSFRSFVASLQLGEREACEARLAQLRHKSPGTAMAYQAAFLEKLTACLALADGRFSDAEGCALRALELAPGNPHIVGGVRVRRGVVALEQDTLDPVRLDKIVAAAPNPWIEAVAALVRAERGEVDAAAMTLDAFAGRDDFGIPFNYGQAPVLRMLSETAAQVGDASFAGSLVPYVTPYEGQLLVGYFGEFCDGAADRALGQLALTRRDPDTAVAHLDVALALEERFRAPALSARTRYWLARALRARGSPGDHERARAELTVAARTATDLGLAATRHLIERLDGRSP